MYSWSFKTTFHLKGGNEQQHSYDDSPTFDYCFKIKLIQTIKSSFALKQCILRCPWQQPRRLHHRKFCTEFQKYSFWNEMNQLFSYKLSYKKCFIKPDVSTKSFSIRYEASRFWMTSCVTVSFFSGKRIPSFPTERHILLKKRIIKVLPVLNG